MAWKNTFWFLMNWWLKNKIYFPFSWIMDILVKQQILSISYGICLKSLTFAIFCIIEENQLAIFDQSLYLSFGHISGDFWWHK
jgi:hypothetical protein